MKKNINYDFLEYMRSYTSVDWNHQIVVNVKLKTARNVGIRITRNI
ncbi:MAG: hypothetical protein RR623_09330 [Bacilli bacterium]